MAKIDESTHTSLTGDSIHHVTLTPGNLIQRQVNNANTGVSSSLIDERKSPIEPYQVYVMENSTKIFSNRK